jgi:hypothetical protein
LQYPQPDVQADDPEQMTAGVKTARPVQPTPLVRNIESVMPSRFAGVINILQVSKEQKEKSGPEGQTGRGDEEAAEEEDEDYSDHSGIEPPPEPEASPVMPTQHGRPLSPAPVAQLGNDQGVLLVEYPHGEGRIILLSDPFIVANNGISRADNLQLAISTITTGGGLIAFDEYHQGHAVTQNELFAYFAGTPVMPILGQASLILLAVLWTRGRRFARPLPLPHVDRRSKLEFVASMAELQQRARAYDLAIENIYARTRRVLARYAGVDNSRSRTEIAAGVAARSSLGQQKIESVMRECEDAINGAPINDKKALQLIARLRWLERSLGLGMRSREARQAKEMPK